MRVVCVVGYVYGFVFSIKELRVEEVFEVKVEELDEKWVGFLWLGLIILVLGEMGFGVVGSGLGLFFFLLEFWMKIIWMVFSCEVRCDGQFQRMNYGWNLERLGVGSCVGVCWGVDDMMYILVDGEDMGFVVIGIVKNVWVVLDFYGLVCSVLIVSFIRLEELEGIQFFFFSLDIGSEGEEDDEGEEYGLGGQNEVGIIFIIFEFLENYGKNIFLFNGNCIVIWVVSYNQGIVVINQFLVFQLLVQVWIDFLN